MHTLAELNRRISHLNLECVKHNDYFWFMHKLPDTLYSQIPDSVYVRRFKDLSMVEWVKHVEDAQK